VPDLDIIVFRSVAWQSFANRGVESRISLKNVQRASPQRDKDQIPRRRSRAQWNGSEFASDLQNVLRRMPALIRTSRPYLDADANFWGGPARGRSPGVSGLDTVLSGVVLSPATGNTEANRLRKPIYRIGKRPLAPAGQKRHGICAAAPMTAPSVRRRACACTKHRSRAFWAPRTAKTTA